MLWWARERLAGVDGGLGCWRELSEVATEVSGVLLLAEAVELGVRPAGSV